MNQPPDGRNGGWPAGPPGSPGGPPAHGSPPAGHGGYGPPQGGASPYGAPRPAAPYGAAHGGPPAYGAPGPASPYGPPPGAAPPQLGAPPVFGGAPGMGSAGWPSPMVAGGVDEKIVKAAGQDPQNVFLAELLGTGIFCLPGIGHCMVGEVGLGVGLLIGYPLVITAFWTCIVLFTCGIGSLLVPLQIPINFLVGYLLGERMKARVLDAKARLGR